MAMPKKTDAEKVVRVNFSLPRNTLAELDEIARTDAARMKPPLAPNRSATVARLVAKEYARRERATARKSS